MNYDTKGQAGPFISSDNKSNDVSINIYKNSRSDIGIPLNANRKIDLLSMEEFGYNNSLLRKSISIVDSNCCNTDKEYGVMQVDDKYEFIPTYGESVSDVAWTISNRQSFAITSGSVANAFSLDTSDIVVTGNILMLPCIVMTRPTSDNKDIYGLQCISMSGNVSWKIGDQSVTNTGSSLLDQNNVMTKDTGWYNFNSSGDGHQYAGIKVKNLEEVSEYAIAVKVKGFNPNAEATSTVAKPGDNTWHNADIYSGGADFKDFGFDCLVYKRDNSGQFIYDHTASFTYDVVNRDGNGDISWFRLSLTTGQVLPQCEIVIYTITDGPTTIENTIPILKSASYTSSHIDIVTNYSNETNVIDWSYGLYVNCKFSNGTTSFKPTLVKSSDIDFYMITDSQSITCLANKGYSARPLVASYYELFKPSPSFSIGIIRRYGDLCQIGIKYLNRYYTARYDMPIGIDQFKIKNIQVITSSDFNIDFIVTYDDESIYYNFFRSDYIEGNKLLPGSKLLYVFTSNKINKLIDKDEVVSIYTKNHDLPTVQCGIINIDSNVYSRATKIFPIPLSKNGTTKTNTVFMANTINGLRDSLLEINGVGKFVTNNTMFYMPNAVNLNVYVGYSDNKAYPFIRQSDNSSIYKHICSLPSYDDALSNFTSMPSKMSEEYPEIYNNVSVCSNTFSLGTRRFVSIGGFVYGASKLLLCPDQSVAYTQEGDAKIYVQSGFLFLSKDKLTNVYTFTELGLVLSLVIEDKIICNPVKISTGIIACGVKGLWQITQYDVRLIWKSPSSISEASLKTDIDNSCIAILYSGLNDISSLQCYDGSVVVDVLGSDSEQIGIGNIVTTCVSINQFGYITKQDVSTSVSTINLIDVGSTYDLVVVDVINNKINKLYKSEDIISYYKVISNSNIEYYGECIDGMLIQIELFALGSGDVEIRFKSEFDDDIVYYITIGSSNYMRYKKSVSIPMNMLKYELNIPSTVKIMQRIIGTISLKEVYHG